MKTKLVDNIVNNEEHVRLRIFDGEFTPDEAYEELLSIEIEQRKSDNLFNQVRIERLISLIRTLSPKGKKMNEVSENVVETVQAELVPISGPNFVVDPDGGFTEVTTEEVFVTSEGTVAVTE